MKRTPTPSDGCIAFVISLCVLLPAAAWAGFVVHKLWAWFVSSIFHIQSISTWEGAGLYLLVHYMTMDSRNLAVEKSDDPYINFFVGLLQAALVPAGALAFGAIYHVLNH